MQLSSLCRNLSWKVSEKCVISLSACFQSTFPNDKAHRRSNGVSVNQIEVPQTPEENLSQARPFSQIPGPLALPLIGSSYLYVLQIYDPLRPHHSGLKKYLKYGPLVKESFGSNFYLVSVYDPNDIELVFRSDGSFPQRRSHLAIENFRKERSSVYNSGGLLPTNGEEWWRIRKEFQKGLSAPQSVRAYLPATDEVVKSFVSERLLDPHDDLLPYISRLFLELTGLVAFDVDLHSFSAQEMAPDSRSSRLMEAAFTTNSLILPLDTYPKRWQERKTAPYRKFEDAMLYMEGVAVDLVMQKAELLSKEKKEKDANEMPSLLEQYLNSPVLDFKDVVGMAVDMLLAGIDTTTYTTCFALYHLAKNPKSQKLLQQEAETLLGSLGTDNRTLTAEMLNRAPYARAVLKEAFRMNPISIGIGRIASKDLVLSGYRVPKGTVLVTQNQVTSRLEKYFPSPNIFIPERWLKGHELQTSRNPYLVLPFGHGPRSCIARRLAEQHILSILLRVAHKFTIQCAEDYLLDCEAHLINKPDKPVKLNFTPHVIS